MKFLSKSQKAGLSPGSLVYVGDPETTHQIKLTNISYNQNSFHRDEFSDPTECLNSLKSDCVNWINLDGVHEVEKLKVIGDFFKLHPLVLEDILNTKQRPKVEFYEDYIYTTLKMISYDEESEKFIREQISIILLKNTVITFQQFPEDIFNSIRLRIKEGKGRVRKMGSDYLLYAILDSIVDGYFIVNENLDMELERIEETIDTDESIMAEIQWFKKELLFIRRAISPVKDITSAILREESQLITEKTTLFYKDAYDHCIQVYEAVELNREIASGLTDVHLSTLSNRMNEVMKFLTVFSAIFIPLTFLTGIYGMNFEYMPELKYRYGYHILIVVLVTVFLSLFVYFRRKKWF
tara:strand:- start:1963 stop:3018 length:1056 start_codon:yes stop_codon:yes gene_type:complete